VQRLGNQSEANREAQKDMGLEQAQGAAYSMAYREIGPVLARLVDAWPKLAEPLKTAIRAIVAASEPGK